MGSSPGKDFLTTGCGVHAVQPVVPPLRQPGSQSLRRAGEALGGIMYSDALTGPDKHIVG